MKQVGAGSPEESRVAFEVLYTRWKKPIMSYLYQLVQDSKTAEDLLQETFLKVFRSRAQYQPTAKFSTWLWTIARNTAYDSLRKKTEFLGIEEDGALEIDASERENAGTSNPEDQLDQAWMEWVSAQKMRKCLAELTPRARTVVELRIFSEEDYEAISKITSESLGNVKTLIFRAKEALKKCFEGAK